MFFFSKYTTKQHEVVVKYFLCVGNFGFTRLNHDYGIPGTLETHKKGMIGKGNGGSRN